MLRTSSIYTVQINYVAGGTNGDGFIDNQKVENYMANGAAMPNASVWTSKVRGNIRYRMIIDSLDLIENCYLTNVAATGANAGVAATSITFWLEAERGDATLFTKDELNPGQMLTGGAAIQRAVARAMTQTKIWPTAFIAGTTISATAGPLCANIAVANPLITVNEIVADG